MGREGWILGGLIEGKVRQAEVKGRLSELEEEEELEERDVLLRSVFINCGRLE